MSLIDSLSTASYFPCSIENQLSLVLCPFLCPCVYRPYILHRFLFFFWYLDVINLYNCIYIWCVLFALNLVVNPDSESSELCWSKQPYFCQKRQGVIFFGFFLVSLAYTFCLVLSYLVIYFLGDPFSNVGFRNIHFSGNGRNICTSLFPLIYNIYFFLEKSPAFFFVKAFPIELEVGVLHVNNPCFNMWSCSVWCGVFERNWSLSTEKIPKRTIFIYCPNFSTSPSQY